MTCAARVRVRDVINRDVSVTKCPTKKWVSRISSYTFIPNLFATTCRRYSGGEKETDEFFRERGLTRCDVWTKEHPTVLKKGRGPKDLLTKPPQPKSEREAMEVLGKKKGYFDKLDLGKKSGGAAKSSVMKSGAK